MLLPHSLITAQSPALKTATDHQLFAYFLDKVLPLMTRPYVQAEFQRHPYHLAVALQQPIVMDVLLATAAMHHSAEGGDMQVQALKYYSTATFMLRQKIAAGEIDGAEDWLALMVMALCLFERWNPSRHPKAGSHLLGACQILRLRHNYRQRRHDDFHDLKFDRCLAETVVYHLSVLPIFEGAHLTRYHPWWAELMSLLTMKAFPDQPQWANSPLLGGRPSLFRIIGDVTRIRHAEQSKEYITLLTQQLSDQEYLIHHGSLATWDDDRKLACYRELRLFSTSARILLAKSIHPDLSATEASVQDLVCQGIEQLSSWPSTARFDQYFCWPLLVMGCAVTSPEHLSIIRQKLAEMWQCSRCGDAWRVKAVLESVWTRPRGTLSEGDVGETLSCGSSSSAFDLLLSREGVFQMLRTRPTGEESKAPSQ